MNVASRSLAIAVLSLAALASPARAEPRPDWSVDPVPGEYVDQMRGVSLHEGCPVGPEQLRVLTIPYVDFAGRVQRGRLMVHEKIASATIAAFRALLARRFPIEKMRLIEEYDGDDDRSMADNNTSGFNCRRVVGKPRSFSLHALGRAIDVNPVQNPYFVGRDPRPPESRDYADRRRARHPGMILRGSAALRAFADQGFEWGAALWPDEPDYQHFQIPAPKRRKK